MVTKSRVVNPTFPLVTSGSLPVANSSHIKVSHSAFLQKIHVVNSFFSFRIVSVFVFVPAGFSNHYGCYFDI